MPKVKQTPPKPSREKGQRSLDLPDWLYRILPPWQNPRKFLEADTWRAIVAKEPIATICRETLISNFISLDWKIEPKDSDQRDELKNEIDYYTEFLTYTGDYYYDTIVEWIGKDLLDIPFGGAAEIGRERDAPDGKVLWIELIDGGTLFPTLSKDWPVGQLLREMAMKPIFFPAHAIDRVYYSPYTKIHYEGWGIPPPEKIYLALELLYRGDAYYANLLLDTPEAGILDLGDMSKTSAEEWIKAFRNMLGGIDPMKIPVLYEHNTDVKFVPFGKPPTEMMFDKITARYASIVAAGYGLSLSDIGIQTTTSGGDTLAGSIRDERKSRRTGFARFKKKMISFFNFILPETLYFKIIDQDDELSVALGRARLAMATAAAQLIDKRIFTPQEMRLQMMADGMISISIPEEIPEDEFPDELTFGDNGGSPERPSTLGKPVAPSQGGHGEVIPRGDVFSDEIYRIVNIKDKEIEKMVNESISPLFIEARTVLEDLDEVERVAWQDWHDEILWGDLLDEVPELTMVTLEQSRKNLESIMESSEPWWMLDISVGDVYSDFKYLLSDASEGEFQARIFDIIESANKHLARDIQNCIIAGTRKSLIDADIVAKSLDEQEIIGDNIAVEYVRRELLLLGKRMIDKFARDVTHIIKDLQEI